MGEAIETKQSADAARIRKAKPGASLEEVQFESRESGKVLRRLGKIFGGR
jgi:hypothetical protein